MNEEIKKIKEIYIKKGLYLCAPLLNKECTKENCYINNGCCCHTVNEEYSQEHLLNYITSLQEENQKLNKIIEELEKFCNDEIKNGIKIDFGEETVGISFKQTLTSYEFILNKLTELKKEVK